MSGEQIEPVDLTERCPAIGNIIEDEYICARTANQPHGENIGFFTDHNSRGSTYIPEEEWYDKNIEYYDDWNGELTASREILRDLYGINVEIWPLAQMVWDITTEIGCAESLVEIRGNRYFYVTCRYNNPITMGGLNRHVRLLE